MMIDVTASHPIRSELSEGSEAILASWEKWTMRTVKIADGQRCINCKAPARNGKIDHVPGCPEYVKRSGD